MEERFLLSNINTSFNEQFKLYTKDIQKYLDDPLVMEIMLNPDGTIWLDKAGQDMFPTETILSPSSVERITSLVASRSKTIVTEATPIISSELPDGSRFEGLVSPVVEKPVFSIRKHGSLVMTLEDYINKDIITTEQKVFFENAVLERKNILVAGSTGSGKTTFVNALVHAVSTLTKDHRIISIEDTRELKVSSKNWVPLRTSDLIDMTRLLKSCMRLRPDRILVGEVRGPEALALLKAWNTGHPGGLSTVHANGALASLTRLEQLLLEAGVPQVGARPIIAEAINIVVFLERTKEGRKVTQIIEVKGFSDGFYETETILS